MRTALLLLLILTSGCAHHRLKQTFVSQANGLTDIYERQVLNNLAMFVKNPNALPHFVVADSGGTRSGESGGFGGTAPVSPFFSSIGFSVDTGNDVDWVLSPVKDATRLRLMQCAYRKAVCHLCDPCEKCAQLDKEWTGLSEEERIRDVECNINCGWLCSSTQQKQIPKDCRSFGKHCGTYVWAKPGHERELSQLVFTILEFATGNPAQAASEEEKKVTVYVNRLGIPVSSDEAVMEIVADVPEGTDPADTFALLGLPSIKGTSKQPERLSYEINKSPDFTDPLESVQGAESLPNSQSEESGTSIIPSPFRKKLDIERALQHRETKSLKRSIQPYNSPSRFQIRGGPR